MRLGKTVRSDFMRIHVLKKEEGEPRLGIMVTKGAGSAVKRNKIRRRIRQAFAELLSGKQLSADIVVYVNSDISFVGFRDLKIAAADLAKRAGVPVS